MEDQIAQYIETVLQREPNANEVAGWVALIDSGAMTIEEVRDAIIDSAEAQTDVYPVILGYQGIYGRVPDADGLDFWVNRYRDVQSLDNPATTTVNEGLVELLKPFVDPAVTQEFVIRFGANPSGAQFVTATYTNVLNRAPDAEGLGYWTQRYAEVRAQVDAQNPDATDAQVDVTTRAIILEQFVSSVEYRTETAEEVDAFLTGVADGDPDAYDGSLWDLETPGGTFTFTPDSGEIVTGSTAADVYNAIVGGANATFNAFDQLQDAGGTGDVFNLVVRGAGAIPPGSSVSGAEIINLDQTTADFNPTAAIGDTTFSGAFFQGAEEIWQIEGFQHITGLTAGQTAGFRDTVSGAGEVLNHWAQWADGVAEGTVALNGVDSGSAIGFLGNGLTTATVTGSVDSAGGGAPGQLTINIASSVLIPAVADTDIDTDITTLNLALTNNTAVNVIGNDAVDLVTVDASASTGGITTNIATGGDNILALASVIGGSGNDNMTVDLASFTAPAVTVSGNAGNDMLQIVADGVPSTTAVALTVNMGAGNDTLDVDALANILTVSNAGITAGLVTVTDFSAANDVLDLSTLAHLQDVLTNTELANVAASTSLLTAVQAAAALQDGLEYVAFDFGGDAYIFVNNGADMTFDAGDGLIRLVGMSVDQFDASNFVA